MMGRHGASRWHYAVNMAGSRGHVVTLLSRVASSWHDDDDVSTTGILGVSS